MSEDKKNRSLIKAFDVIDAIAEGDRQLKDISRRLNLPKSTVHRLLRGLIEGRYVREVHGIGLVLGTKVIQLGIQAQRNMPLKEIAHPFLRELSEKTKETVHLGIKDEDEVFYLDKFPGQRAIQLRSQVGDRLPLGSTGVGKSLMLDLPKMEWVRLFNKQTPDRLDDMLERMALYSEQDCSFDLEDNDELVHCVAVPIRNKYGNIIAAISITSIKEYMPVARMNELLPILRECSSNISKSIN